jgi:hypothetical protein
LLIMYIVLRWILAELMQVNIDNYTIVYFLYETAKLVLLIVLYNHVCKIGRRDRLTVWLPVVAV